MLARDVFLVLLALSAAYISLLHPPALTLSAHQFVALDPSLYANGHGPGLADRLPAPVVADLDGDGCAEMVVATRMPELLVVRSGECGRGSGSSAGGGGGSSAAGGGGSSAGGGGGSFSAGGGSSSAAGGGSASFAAAGGRMSGFAGAEVLQRVSLLPRVLVAYGRKPVALAVGHLDPRDPLRPREAVVVVVTDEWTVLMFDARLRLVWETSLQEDFSHHFAPVEVTVAIAETPLLIGDRGCVIVGGRTRRIDPRGSGRHSFDTDPAGGSSTDDNGLGGVAAGASTAQLTEVELDRLRERNEHEARLEAQAGHFSYYALDGRTGAQRWKHELSDFAQNLHDEEVTMPQRSYRLELRPEAAEAHGPAGLHAGEMDWRNFRESVIASLPHAWQGPEDTRMYPAHFVRHRARRSKHGRTGSRTSIDGGSGGGGTGGGRHGGRSGASHRAPQHHSAVSDGRVVARPHARTPTESRHDSWTSRVLGSGRLAAWLGYGNQGGSGRAAAAVSASAKRGRTVPPASASAGRPGGGAEAPPPSAPADDPDGGAALEFVSPIDEHAAPNVIVAHIAEGLQVLHLYSGRALTRLTLLHGLYTDLDGDGVVDHALALSGRSPDALDGLKTGDGACEAAIFAGVPPLEMVANVSLCGASSMDADLNIAAGSAALRRTGVFSKMHAGGGGDDADDADAAPIGISADGSGGGGSRAGLAGGLSPVAVHSVDPWSGTVETDVVFLLPGGRLTSVSRRGHVNWRVATRAAWAPEEARSLEDGDGAEDGGGPRYSVVPSLVAFHELSARPPHRVPRRDAGGGAAGSGSRASSAGSARGFDPNAAAVAAAERSRAVEAWRAEHSRELIAAAGDSWLVIADPATGETMATAHLPEPPLAHIGISDLDSDGRNDIVVVCRTGIYTFKITAGAAGIAVGLRIMVGSVIAIALALAIAGGAGRQGKYRKGQD
jgi:hypothetical protein